MDKIKQPDNLSFGCAGFQIAEAMAVATSSPTQSELDHIGRAKAKHLCGGETLEDQYC